MSHSPVDLNARRLGGYSLVELLVALLIALFLLAGLLTIVQSMRNTFNTQSSLAQLEDSERLAMIMMTNVIQTAGYFTNPLANTADSALPVASWPDPDGTGAFQLGQAIAGDGNASPDGVPGDADAVSVRFQTASIAGGYTATNDANIVNCLGVPNTSGTNVTYTNTFSIDANGNLDCTLSTNGNAQAPVQLVAGVKNLQIWYGVATSAASGDNVDTYLTATQMTPADWLNVTSVKVRLTFANAAACATAGVTCTVQSLPALNYLESVVAVMARAGVTT